MGARTIIDQDGRARLTLVRPLPSPVAEESRTVEAAKAEKLWGALFAARSGNSAPNLADLEDTVFRFYLPMARTLAHDSVDAAGGSTAAAEQAAELGLAQAVLAWRHRDSREFRRFATSSIQLQLNGLG